MLNGENIGVQHWRAGAPRFLICSYHTLPRMGPHLAFYMGTGIWTQVLMVAQQSLWPAEPSLQPQIKVHYVHVWRCHNDSDLNVCRVYDVYVYVSTPTHHSTHVEVSEQLSFVFPFLLPLKGSGVELKLGFFGKHPYRLSHLEGLLVFV